MTPIAALSGKSTKILDAPLLVTGGLVLVVISMVIPLPAGVLDFGIAISIATAVMVLVMASLVEKPTDFQAFPVLLLVSLVIRLSLNVSSTRLILTEGQNGKEAAGSVINGFAEFVAGGSILVGITIFAVISVVNFMVITKGSGRMAEVAARFALDSLPGKQLAIDGDLNAGAIDHQEAKRRRIQEQREISFFGSLDGASKFVKGDAVAGIVITLINLCIGLVVGITIHGMPLGEAAATYSHLTVGDGLVSQIPALITSMAAALLLSRGGATETTAGLMSTEFVRSWQPAAMVAAAMAVISLVPVCRSRCFWGSRRGWASWPGASRRNAASRTRRCPTCPGRQRDQACRPHRGRPGHRRHQRRDRVGPDRDRAGPGAGPGQPHQQPAHPHRPQLRPDPAGCAHHRHRRSAARRLSDPHPRRHPRPRHPAPGRDPGAWPGCRAGRSARRGGPRAGLFQPGPLDPSDRPGGRGDHGRHRRDPDGSAVHASDGGGQGQPARTADPRRDAAPD